MGINETNVHLQRTPVAIIGMASIFPQARNLQEYWTNIVSKTDCITDVPPSRWNIEDYYDPNPRAKDKTYCKRGGFIPEVDFNPMEFGLPPNVLEYTDISQLLGLLIAKEAMEDAGYGESRDFDRERTGVILGVALGRQLMLPFSTRLQYPVWEKALKNSGLSDEDTQKVIEKIKSAYLEWDENAFPGMLANVVSGRIANRLDLGGMNCVVDAACASSLGALSLALSELTTYRAHMMLAGGVDTDNSPMAYMCFSKTPALTDQETSRPFDHQSRGIMLGEGVGMMVLKRLEDAERDQDRIYAVIRGIGSSSDGRYKSIYAPRPEGQVRALRRAYEDAGVSPLTVDLIEAHGTGTMAGDPAEFKALTEVFSANNPRKQHVALGTVKSQIGHTKAAAGAASMIKAALALHHKVLPPTINVTQPHSKLKIEDSPFYLNTESRPWIRHQERGPRRASVSSFGFGGTNYHVVLEEYEHEHTQGHRLHPVPLSVLLAAETSAQLLGRCEEALAKLKVEDESARYEEIMASYQASVPLPKYTARVGFVAASQAECREQLRIAIDCLKKNLEAESWEHPMGVYYRKTAFDTQGKVVALFSGQGAQYLHMGQTLSLNFPQLRQTYSQMDQILNEDSLQPVSELVFPPPAFTAEVKQLQTKALQQTEYAQPAIGAFSVSLYKILQAAGFQPDFAAGHSFGELTALWAAGVLREENYFSLVKARGQAMAAPKKSGFDAGAMLAVKEDIEKVLEEIKDFPQITVSNVNSNRQLVLAGTSVDIAQIQQVLQERGYDPVLLPVSAAFHTPLVRHAQEPFAEAVAKVPFQPASIPVYTNVTGKSYPADRQEMQEILKRHLVNPVLFKDEIENIYAAGGRCFVEFGPRHVLTNLVKDILGDRPYLAVALNTSPQKDSDRQLREAVVQLQVAGLSLNNLDPYQRVYTTLQVQPNKLNVRLDSVNYVSEKAKKAHAEALNNGHQVVLKSSEKTHDLQILSPVTSLTKTNGNKESAMSIKNGNHAGEIQAPISVSPSVSKAESIGKNTKAVSPATAANSSSKETGVEQEQKDLGQVEWSLAQLMKHQSEILQLQEQYLKYQTESAKCFFQLMDHQSTLLSVENPVVPMLESLERSMMRFHDHQADTLRVHEQSIGQQTEYGKSLVQLIQKQYDFLTNGDLVREPAIEQPRDSSALAESDSKSMKSTSTLPNIDTVHQPQQNALKPQANSAISPPPEPEVVVTPEPVLGNSNGTKFAQDPIQEVPVPVDSDNKVESVVPTSPSTAPALDFSIVSEALLKVVSEKTGYPTEMLDLGMDMEADLGIDSIKRVEILGALQEHFPNLPKPNPEELVEIELLTLGQILDYMQSLAPTTVPTEHEALSEIPIASMEVQVTELTTSVEAAKVEKPQLEIEDGVRPFPSPSTPTMPEPIAVPAEIAKAPETVDFSALSDSLLEVVSEKTGYPTEMLEMEMDMEADLGIDSIKRVEILGALQERFPDLPKPNPEELVEVELRTLGQIVDYIKSLAPTHEKKKSLAPPEISHSIVRAPVRLRFLPEPDILEDSFPEGSLGVLTDDGSELTNQIAHALVAKDWKLIVLSFPSSKKTHQAALPEGVHQVVLENLSEEHLKEKVTALTDRLGMISAFIHLHPQGFHREQEEAVLKGVFFLAKYLKDSLNQTAETRRACFFTVARLDGAFGFEHQTDFAPLSGGLFGLTKALNREWESVFCRAIDLSPQLDTSAAGKHILAELHDPNRLIAEVAYGARGRTTLVC